MKELKTILLIYLTALFSVTILPRLSIFGAEPNLILTMAIVYLFSNEIKKGLLWAICGGLFLDFLGLRSMYNTLTATVLILLIYLLIKRFFEGSNIYIFLIFVLLGNLIYSALLFMWQNKTYVVCFGCLKSLIAGAIYSTLVGLVIYIIRKRA